MRFKVYLHYGKNRSKLVKIKNYFFKYTSLEQFSPFCKYHLNLF